MMWLSVFLASCGLVALGCILLVRDYVKARAARRERLQTARRVTAPPRPALRPQDGAMPRTASKPPPASRTARPMRTAAIRPAPAALDGPPQSSDGPLAGPALPRNPDQEARWPTLRDEISAAITLVNGQIAPLDLLIAAPGDPTWSMKNSGFGDYRRVLIDEESLAWLRCEVTAEHSLCVKVRAHDPENNVLNATHTVPAARHEGQLVQTIMAALSTTTQYARWRQANVPRQARPSAPAVEVAAPLPSAAAPPTATAMSDAAIGLVNTAFVESGARLMPLRANQWPGTVGRDARVLAIDANGALAGIMLVDPRPDRIEIAVTAGRSATASAAERKTLPLAGLTIHALAETVASAAWPAIVAALPPTR